MGLLNDSMLSRLMSSLTEPSPYRGNSVKSFPLLFKPHEAFEESLPSLGGAPVFKTPYASTDIGIQFRERKPSQFCTVFDLMNLSHLLRYDSFHAEQRPNHSGMMPLV